MESSAPPSSDDSFHTVTGSDSADLINGDSDCDPDPDSDSDSDRPSFGSDRWRNRATYLGHDEEGLTPLHNAAYNGKVSKVRQLLEAGENVDAMRGGIWGCRVSKMTPLMVAALSGQPAVVELLLRHGADMSIKCDQVFGMPAAGLAMLWGEEERVHILDTLLVHWGDSLEKLDCAGFGRFRKGASLLCFAADIGLVECVRVLLKHGASLERRFLVSDTELGSDDSDDSDSHIPPTDDVNPPEPNPPRAQTVLEFAEEGALLYRHHSPVFDEVVEVLRQEAARRSTEPGIASLLELSRLKVRLVAGRGGRSVEIKVDSWVESGVLPSYLKPYILYKRFEE